MKKNCGNHHEMEIVLERETVANVNPSRVGSLLENSDCKTIEFKEELTHIIMPKHVGPPECIDLDDDSDEDITFLGTFTSSEGPSKNTQISNVKAEATTISPPQQAIHKNLSADSEDQDIRNSQYNISTTKVLPAFIKNTTPTKEHVSTSLPVVGEKSSCESQYDISESTSSSVIQSVINRGNKTTCANSDTIPPEKGFKSACHNNETVSKIPSGNQEKQAISVLSYQEINLNHNIGLTPKTNTSNLHSKLCPPQEKSMSLNQLVSNTCSSQENNPSFRDEVGKISVSQETNKSCSVAHCSSETPKEVSGVSTIYTKDKDATTLMQSHILNNGPPTTFGNAIKQQVRYVTLPAKFLSGKISKQFTSGTSPGNSILKVVHAVSKHPVNTKVLNAELPSSVGDKTLKSVGSMVQESGSSGSIKTIKIQGANGGSAVTSKKIVFVQNNPNDITKSNSTRDDKKTGPPPPPPMLLFNNQIIKLKGIKQQESQSKDIGTSIHNPDNQRNNLSPLSVKPTKSVDQYGQTDNSTKSVVDQRNNLPPVSVKPTKSVDQCGQTDNTTKSVVDKSCQTYIYSWMYKNAKLYTFVDDEGTQVQLVPVNTARVVKPPVKTAPAETIPVETNFGSPVSSLDNESDTCLEEEINVTDDPVAYNQFVNKHDHSTENIAMRTSHEESHNNNSNVWLNQPHNPPSNCQPQNTFQEVLYTDLGLYNPISKSVEDTQANAYSNQSSGFQSNVLPQLENTNINTVYNHELQMYVPTSQNTMAQSDFEQPAFCNNDIQNHEQPDFANHYIQNHTPNPTMEIFTKLVEDIRTCLFSDALGNIPLHQAAINNDLVKLQSQCIVLKTIGSNLNHINLAHETALMLAVKEAVNTRNYQSVSILILEGADQRIADQEGNTPLHYAVRNGCDQVVRILLTADDADNVIERFNYDGFTPLHIAAIEGYDDIIKLLLVGTNIDINIKDRKNGRTPYFLAAKENKWTSTNLLIMLGADVYEPNFADQTPLSAASPDKNVLPPHIDELSVDDPDDIPPIVQEIQVPPVKGNSTVESHLSQLRTAEPTFVYFERNETGLKPPSEILRGNESKNVDGTSERAPKASNVKKLYDKYVKIAAKRKSDSQLEEPIAKLKPMGGKETKFPKSIKNKRKEINFQSKNTADSNTNVQNQSHEKVEYIHDTPINVLVSEKWASSTDNSIPIYDSNKFDKIDEIRINNESVLYNKAVLTSTNITAQEHSLNSSEIENEHKSTSETEEDETTPRKEKKLVDKQSTSKKNGVVQGMTLNHDNRGLTCTNTSKIPTEEHSTLKNLPVNNQENVQSSSKVDTDKHLLLSLDNPGSVEKTFVQAKKSVNHNGHSSKDLTRNDQNISSNEMPKLISSERSSELLRKSHLESQEESNLFSKIVNPKSGEKNSVEVKQHVNKIGHSSSIYTAENNQNLLSSIVPLITLGDMSDEMSHLSKEYQAKFQASDELENCSSGNKNSFEPILAMNFTNHSFTVNLTKNDQNTLSSQGCKLTSEKTSNEMEKEIKDNSCSSSEVKSLNRDEINSDGAKHIFNLNCSAILENNDKNTLSTPISSKEKSSRVNRQSQCDTEIDEPLASNSMIYEETQSLLDSNSGKQFTENVLIDNEVPGNEIYLGSGDEDSRFDETTLDLDFGKVTDVIIGNDSFLSKSIDPIKTLSPEGETENVQLSFDALYDIVNIKKKENMSFLNTDNNQRRSQRKKPVDSGEFKKNTQDVEHLNRDSSKKSQELNSADLLSNVSARDSSSTSYPQKAVSGSEVNVINSELSNNICSLTAGTVKRRRQPKSLSYSSESNQVNNLNCSEKSETKIESNGLREGTFVNSESNVFGSEEIQTPENAGAHKRPRKSLSADSESNPMSIGHSSSVLVTNIRNKLVSLVACKVNVSGKNSATVSGSTKSQSKEIVENPVKGHDKSLVPDSRSSFKEQISSSTTSAVHKSSKIQSQENRNTSRKRNLDSMKQNSQETENKIIYSNNTKIEIRKGKHVQPVGPNIVSRKSTRTSKKKVEYH